MNNLRPEDPLRFAVELKTAAEFMRLPPAGTKDPIFQLTRSYLNLLILPCRENDFRPPVRSFVLRRTRKKKGVRIIDISSLREFIQLQREQNEVSPSVNTPKSEPSRGDG
ncbi:MAG: hypothetical protein QM813_03180 [Verrucomicrobiota bacterium]